MRMDTMRHQQPRRRSEANEGKWFKFVKYFQEMTKVLIYL